MIDARILSDKFIRFFDRHRGERKYVIITGKEESLDAVCAFHGTFRGIYKTFDCAQKALMRRGWNPWKHYRSPSGGHFVWEQAGCVAIIADVTINE